MQSSSRFKLITAFCLFVIFAVSLLFLGFTRLPTHAAGSALHKNGKIPASSTSQGAWNVVYSPNVRTGSDFYGVAAISSNDVWAVGSVIEHWNGTKWRVVSNPIPSTANSPGFLRGVTAVSANDVWAVGYFYDFVNKLFVTQTLIKHWNGTAWSVVASPNVGTGYNFLMSVAAISTNDVWAVGYYNTSSGQGTLTEHWDGSSWSVIHSRNVGANGSSFRSVAGASTNDVWAVGYIGWRRTLTEHWDGKNWSVVFSPNPPKSDSGFDGVTVISSNDVWAVGSTLNVGK